MSEVEQKVVQSAKTLFMSGYEPSVKYLFQLLADLCNAFSLSLSLLFAGMCSIMIMVSSQFKFLSLKNFLAKDVSEFL